MSKQQKDQAIEEAARDAALEALEAEHSDKSKPSAAAFFSRDFWEIWGDKLIRYHCISRRENFSPDLTDCPIDIAHLSKSRTCKIVPIGGTSVISDDDEWYNFCARNKKYSFKWIGQTFFDVRKDSQTAPESKDYPSMPIVSEPEAEPEHREKIQRRHPVTEKEIRDLIPTGTRPGGHKELRSNPKAQASLDVDWAKLMLKKAWDMGSVREWGDVPKKAKKKGKKVHVGKVFEICVEKGSELPERDPLRKFKGRTVFQASIRQQCQG